ncbi:serine hydrolase domain-containing protein [Paremcibacter congregatus]|uniref:Beta-lactamase-related domain-containing protein n=1 Tax=Paremcibacter congregatus TaxID=2043170 RepID=A0A2G4YVL9_9PROT|nr:serine hydrolase [Paremcibacter congregatus]PHZ86378.1 hypothetical protein CRD36_00350 [Paremcibacter congregatus]QDE28525.1 serine hydrolase [Paremcibacter congregatus]
MEEMMMRIKNVLKYFGVGFVSLLVLGIIAIVLSKSVRDNTYHVGTIGAAFAAKHVCSEFYLNGRSIDEIFQRDLMAVDERTSLFSAKNDNMNNAIYTNLGGFFSTYAAYRDGLGCTLVHDMNIKEYQASAVRIVRHKKSGSEHEYPLKSNIGNTVNGVNFQKLKQAVENSFYEPIEESKQDTRAVIVLHRGKIIAEKYAPGFGKESLFYSMSMAKSVVATLIGILVDEDKLNIDDIGLFPEWSDLSDQRKNISLHDLLTMSSGLEFEEVEAPGTDLTTMVYRSSDMAAFAANKPLIHKPGTYWSYSSGTSNLLAKVYANQFENLQQAYQFAWDGLFAPADMVSTIFETDQSNVFDAGGSLYATARDWARFGQIYLNRGSINGKRIISEKWVDYVSTPVKSAPIGIYGGQFWLNKGALNDNGEMVRFLEKCPSDLYFALGHFDQIVAIVPSKEAVIVRLGWSTDPNNPFNFGEHICNILSSIEDK